jgi:predicted glycoside hydrolase/deacetylase ChbG (UPF0249 family)
MKTTTDSISHLIINADDLGASRVVNESTIELMAAGRITSATIMGNGPDLPYLRGRLESLRRCSFGVHLNATQYRPLTREPGLRALMDRNDEMTRIGRPFRIDTKLLRGIYAEFCAQVESVGRLGIPLTHLDSHHHVHTQAALFPVLKAVQRRYSIRKIRLSKNLYLSGQEPPAALAAKKSIFNWCLGRLCRTVTTDLFTEFSTFHALLIDGKLPSHVRSVEAMVHPGGARYAEETELLRSDWMERLPPSTALISYAELS